MMTLPLALLATAPAAVANLSPVELFDLADAARAAGRTDNAAKLYDALARDVDPKIRIEARYRKGVMYANLGRYADAATALRAALDEAPGAPVIRLELARVLGAFGDEAGARQQLRQAATLGLPPEIADSLDQFAKALRSAARAGGSIELGLAPDTNINRATNAHTLDTILAPLVLSDDARARAGLGLVIGAQGFVRIPLAPSLSLLPRVATAARLFQTSQFNDVAASMLVGLEWRSGGSRLSPSIGRTWRRFGNVPFAQTTTIALDWVQPLAATRQMVVSASAARARYQQNPSQDGGLYEVNLALEQAVGPRSGLGFNLSATRQTAVDPGFATWSGSAGVQAWRDAGRQTFFASTSLRRTHGDAPIFLFPVARREWLLQARVGARLRSLQVEGFAPIVRLSYERNIANTGLFDYRRLVIEAGIGRAW